MDNKIKIVGAIAIGGLIAYLVWRFVLKSRMTLPKLPLPFGQNTNQSNQPTTSASPGSTSTHINTHYNNEYNIIR